MKILLLIACLCIHINGQDELDWDDDWTYITDDDFDDEDRVPTPVNTNDRRDDEKPKKTDTQGCENSAAFYACQKDVKKFCDSAPCKKRCIFDSLGSFDQECLYAINQDWNEIKLAKHYRSISEPMASDLVKMLTPCDMIRSHNSKHHGHHGNNGYQQHNKDGKKYHHKGWYGHDDDDDDHHHRHHHFAMHRFFVVFPICLLCCCLACFLKKKVFRSRHQNSTLPLSNPSSANI